MFTFVNAKSCMGSNLSEINSWKKNSLRALKYRASTLESGASSCTCPVVTQVTDLAYRIPSQQQDTEQDSSVLLSCWSLSLALLTSHCDTPTAISEVSASLDKQRENFPFQMKKQLTLYRLGCLPWCDLWCTSYLHQAWRPTALGETVVRESLKPALRPEWKWHGGIS